MLEEIDEKRVEPAPSTILKILFDAFLGELCDQRPCRVALHEERLAGGVFEEAGALANRKGKAVVLVIGSIATERPI